MMASQTILLVDDEKILLESIALELKNENFTVLKASNGETAVQMLQENRIDLVVTDLVMPGIDGIQVLNEAKMKSIFTGVIIQTGYGDLTSTIDALRLGADDYLLKPCDIEELILRINRCLEKLDAFRKIKIYEKILPVCAYCKNIRDDSVKGHGKGDWFSLEEYLLQHSGILVTHGCCPNCYKNLKFE